MQNEKYCPLAKEACHEAACAFYKDEKCAFAIMPDITNEIAALSDMLNCVDDTFVKIKATPHKARASRFARILLAYFPSSCTSSPWRASARRRRACTI